jgi:hypothetical protein
MRVEARIDSPERFLTTCFFLLQSHSFFFCPIGTNYRKEKKYTSAKRKKKDAGVSCSKGKKERTKKKTLGC